MRKISWYYENFLMKWWEISWFCYVFMAPSSVFLTFSWEISHNIIILRFCNIVEGQANWLNLTEFKIESKISLLRKILRNILRFGKFFCYKSPNHVQIYDLGHFLGKIMTLLNLCLVLLLDQSIVQGSTLYSVLDCLD